ncbi:hypothetical protein ACJA25_01745 [Mycoplasmopsis hyopharyngis]|uniref:hypothetical protein n=1 Tax=Mycoplasmopsis hyopharyngis TaxID=29558 RepID=UPI003872F2E5
MKFIRKKLLLASSAVLLVALPSISVNCHNTSKLKKIENNINDVLTNDEYYKSILNIINYNYPDQKTLISQGYVNLKNDQIRKFNNTRIVLFSKKFNERFNDVILTKAHKFLTEFGCTDEEIANIVLAATNIEKSKETIEKWKIFEVVKTRNKKINELSNDELEAIEESIESKSTFKKIEEIKEKFVPSFVKKYSEKLFEDFFKNNYKKDENNKIETDKKLINIDLFKEYLSNVLFNGFISLNNTILNSLYISGPILKVKNPYLNQDALYNNFNNYILKATFEQAQENWFISKEKIKELKLDSIANEQYLEKLFKSIKEYLFEKSKIITIKEHQFIAFKLNQIISEFILKISKLNIDATETLLRFT